MTVRSAHGFTLIEVLVAALLLIVGIGAAVAVFASAARQTQTGARQAQVAAIAERELEAIASLPFDQIKLKPDGLNSASQGTGLPADAPDRDNPANPDHYLARGGDCKYVLKVMANYHDADGPALDAEHPDETLVSPPCGNASGAIDHTSTFCASGCDLTAPEGVSGTVYRYVTKRKEYCGPQLPDGLYQVGQTLNDLLQSTQLVSLLGGLLNNLTGSDSTLNLFCGGTQSATKRVTVAAVLNPTPNAPKDADGNVKDPPRPVWMSTIVVNPQCGVINLGGQQCSG